MMTMTTTLTERVNRGELTIISRALLEHVRSTGPAGYADALLLNLNRNGRVHAQ